MSVSKIMNLEEETAAAAAPMKQGIVAILGSDNRENHTYKSSIRRTLSADMSSKKWLEQNGFFSPMKKIVSSEVLVRVDHIPRDSSSVSSSSSSSSGSEENDKTTENPCQDDVWRSIQAGKERNGPSKMDSWGSLLTQRSESSVSLLPPAPTYVHPAVKRAAACLSEKSLQICTESLGSETGSDCFSASAAEINDSDNEDCKLKEVNSFSDLQIVKYKESPARPFPPPLPSIAGGGDGVSLHMQSRRENGRLVLEAVSVPARNYFGATRRDGRLVLTLIRNPAVAEEKKVEEFDGKVFDDMEEVGGDVVEEDAVDEVCGDGGCEEDAAEEVVAEKDLRSIPMSVQKPGLVMKKLVAIGNKNPATWANKFNESVAAEKVVAAAAVEEEEELVIPQSLPPPPRVARLIPSPAPPLTAASFNAYEYFWRNKSAVCGGGGLINPIIATTQHPTNVKHSYNNNVINGGSKAYENQEFIPYLRGCKEPRRSLSWEPYCIATS